MKYQLAETLLARLLAWTGEEAVRERQRLEALARLKYDSYEQFEPGMRFLDSLVLWLKQFRTVSERRSAYEFVIEKLVFVSRAEMEHLIKSAYVDLIHGIITRHAGREQGIADHMISRIASAPAFKLLRRRSLFLGLSDGARTDLLRRANPRRLSNEQVHHSLEFDENRARSMREALAADAERILERAPTRDERGFTLVFLLDDFTGSGRTYIREEGGQLQGKLASFYSKIADPDSDLGNVLSERGFSVYVIFYLAAHGAIEHMKRLTPQLVDDPSKRPTVRTMHCLSDSCRVTSANAGAFHALCLDDRYYDATGLEDAHTQRGGNDAKLGFAGCALPLVLAHNTPNNSVSLLWAYDTAEVRGLFPRVPRHTVLS